MDVGSRYEECLGFVLAQEGGFVDDPIDRGGATNKGITQRTYSAWRRAEQLPDNSVAHIAENEVDTIYHEQYWNPLHCDNFTPPLDLVLFDTAVQHGVSRAVKILQQALTVTVDGVLGSGTLNAALLDSAPTLAGDILVMRARFYTDIVARNPTQAKFANGWANRLDDVRAECGL